MGKTQERIAITSPHSHFDFALANLAASQTATDVPVVGGVANTIPAVKSGCIVGYAIQLSAAFSAGTAEVGLEVGGTESVAVSIDTASTTEYVGTYEYGDYPFSAGDTIGVTYTTDGSASPETNDAIVRVYVIFDDFVV